MKPRNLSFTTEAEVSRDVERLRAGHRVTRQWTFAQTCWHLKLPMESCLVAPARLEPTEAERGMQERLDAIIAARAMPPGLPTPPGTDPPADAGAEAIDAFLAGLDRLAAYREPHADFSFFGPVPTAKLRDFVLVHASHHLGYFEPTSTAVRREGLRFANEDAAIADIERLRNGHEQAGAWTLPQVCWHVNEVMKPRLQPGPHASTNTPEQDARRGAFEQIMASGRIPKLDAPPHLVPPPDAGDDAIDACIATLRQFKSRAGGFAPHRLFGHMPDDVARAQSLIHVAHHLSFLVPTTTTTQSKQ